jgi:hypothetical protein
MKVRGDGFDVRCEGQAMKDDVSRDISALPVVGGCASDVTLLRTGTHRFLDFVVKLLPNIELLSTSQ